MAGTDVSQQDQVLQALQFCVDHPESVGKFGEDWCQVPDIPTPDPLATERFYHALSAYLQAMEFSHPYLRLRHFPPNTLKQGFFSKVSNIDWTGSHLVEAAQHLLACEQREKLEIALHDAASKLEDFQKLSVPVSQQISLLEKRLQGYLTIATAYLREHPEWGTEPADWQIRERVQKRLAALESLTLVLRQQQAQAELAKRQVSHHLDLYYRVRDVLIPLLHQHEDQAQAALSLKTLRRAYRSFHALVGPLHQPIQQQIGKSTLAQSTRHVQEAAAHHPVSTSESPAENATQPEAQ